jgi:hypothetical protein
LLSSGSGHAKTRLGGLVEPVLRDELAVAAPVVPDGGLESGFGKVGVVAHDDLEPWCEVLGEVAQKAEDATDGGAVGVIFGDATLERDLGGIVGLGWLV